MHIYIDISRPKNKRANKNINWVGSQIRYSWYFVHHHL
jgi:hypothetical protein